MSDTYVYAVVDDLTLEISKGDDILEAYEDRYDLVDGVHWERFKLVREALEGNTDVE